MEETGKTSYKFCARKGANIALELSTRSAFERSRWVLLHTLRVELNARSSMLGRVNGGHAVVDGSVPRTIDHLQRSRSALLIRLGIQTESRPLPS
ncbi:unnamed protein product [Citrullus colocynthis]|uniref:Uncharacterized protein n=1 Tax=Citrullus colocynthis TaxID=252529 RepID=A0ABP0XME1_9ROSI